MNKTRQISADNAAKTEKTARLLSTRFPSPPFRVYLRGELAAGKTLWTRALLHALGVDKKVTSPSYVTAKTYAAAAMRVHHLDLFRHPKGARLADEFYELINDDALCIVEWAERAIDLPPPDLTVTFLIGEGDARRLCFTADGKRGLSCLRAFAD